MSDQKRRYKMKRRAEQEAQTKLRITESAVDLHGSLGPARTTISAVAEHAGVRRSTVYRHFPDERALFGACSAHWAQANPPPDVDGWASIEDPDERLDTALAELYAYYRRTSVMIDRLLRDAPSMPVVEDTMAPFRQFLASIADVLIRGRGVRGKARDRVRAALGHAVSFRAWQELTETQGLSDADGAELMKRLVDAAGAGAPVSSSPAPSA
jgi:AcrR family transcriptional regulator